jgi:hypothetical protein
MEAVAGFGPCCHEGDSTTPLHLHDSRAASTGGTGVDEGVLDAMRVRCIYWGCPVDLFSTMTNDPWERPRYRAYRCFKGGPFARVVLQIPCVVRMRCRYSLEALSPPKGSTRNGVTLSTALKEILMFLALWKGRQGIQHQRPTVCDVDG